MKEKTNIRFGIILSYITLAANIIVTVFFTPFILRKIGDDQYGLLSFVNSLTSWLTVLTSALGSAYIRFATIETANNGSPNRINSIYAKLFLILSCAVCLISIAASTILFAGLIPFENYTESQKRIIPILFVISSLQIVVSVALSVFSLFNNYKKKFIFIRSASLLVVILNVIFTLVAIMLGGNIVSIAVVHLAVNFLSLLANALFSLKSGFKFAKASIKENKGLVINLAVFSSFILLNSIVDQINNSLDKTILGFLSAPETVTVYQLGQSFSTYLITMSVAVSSTFVPKINELVAQNKKDEYHKLFLKVSWLQSAIIVFAVGGFAISGIDFASAWLSGTETDPKTVFVLAIVLLALYMIPLTENSTIEIQRAMNRHKFRSVSYIIIAAANAAVSIILVYVLPDDLAVYGCLIGTVFAMVVGNWIVMNIYNKKAIGLPIEKYLLMLASFLGIAAASCAICFVATNWIPWGKISRWIVFIVKAVIYTFAYGLLMIIFYRKKISNLIMQWKKKKVSSTGQSK